MKTKERSSVRCAALEQPETNYVLMNFINNRGNDVNDDEYVFVCR